MCPAIRRESLSVPIHPISYISIQRNRTGHRRSTVLSASAKNSYAYITAERLMQRASMRSRTFPTYRSRGRSLPSMFRVASFRCSARRLCLQVSCRTMKAAVIHEAGGPEVLKLETRPVPKARPGWVLIRVKAFGLNRSELFTRQGHSPNVAFPRILGIEASGVVEDSPGGEFQRGDVVATAMGGLGRDFDGGYAEYTCVPVGNVQVSIR